MPETSQVPDLAVGVWDIDPAHSEITFTIRHLMTTVRGSFTDFSGQIDVAEDPFASRANAEIAVASIDTRKEERDAHIRSHEIMDTERYPTMSFTTTGVSPARRGAHAPQPRLNVDGLLTIRGVTNPVRLLTEFYGVGVDQYGGTRAGFTATTTINREDYGIAFNIPLQGEQVLLGGRIDIALEIQAVHAGR